MAGPVAKTPVWRGTNYDGNGKLSQIEMAKGVKLVSRDKDGKGWVRNESRGKMSATLSDSSATNQGAKMEKLEKALDAKDATIEKYASLVKDMDKRLRDLEDRKGGK